MIYANCVKWGLTAVLTLLTLVKPAVSAGIGVPQFFLQVETSFVSSDIHIPQGSYIVTLFPEGPENLDSVNRSNVEMIFVSSAGFDWPHVNFESIEAVRLLAVGIIHIPCQISTSEIGIDEHVEVLFDGGFAILIAAYQLHLESGKTSYYCANPMQINASQ